MFLFSDLSGFTSFLVCSLHRMNLLLLSPFLFHPHKLLALLLVLLNKSHLKLLKGDCTSLYFLFKRKMFNDLDNEVVFFVKPLFLLLGGLLFAAGIGELVCSILAINDSGGYYIGGIYVGAIAVITGLMGFRVSLKKSLFACIVLYLATLITAIVSTALQVSMNSYVQNIKACSSYSDSKSYSCNTLLASNYLCYGNDNYYHDAQNCESNYVNNYGTGDQSCSCVQQDTSTCYTFTNVPSCERFTNALPGAIQASYYFAIIVVILSAALFVLSVISFGCFQCNSNPEPTPATAPTTNGYAPAPIIIKTTIQTQENQYV